MKKNILIFLLLSLSAFQMASARSFGQVRNLINADNKPYHFGFILGFNSMDFNVSHNGIVDKDGNRWYADQTGLAVGFTVGIIFTLDPVIIKEVGAPINNHNSDEYCK